MKKSILLICALSIVSCGQDETEILSSENTKVLSKTYKNGTQASEKTFSTIVVKRYYSDGKKKHFFGVNSQPIGSQPNTLRWRLEGNAFRLSEVPILGSYDQVVSLVNSNLDNLLTTNAQEIQNAKNNGYVQIEVLGYTSPSGVNGSVPVYRYFSPSKGGHLFTTNWNELGAGSNGYIYEGIHFYAQPSF